MKLEAQQLEKAKIQQELQARISARLAEMTKVDSLLYQKSLEKGLPYTFDYQGVSVKEKALKNETSLSSEHAACMRQLSDAVVALLGTEEYRKYLEDQQIATIDFRLFDNRESSRSDKMFGVGTHLRSETVKPGIPARRVCVSTYGDTKGQVTNDPQDCVDYASIYSWRTIPGVKPVERRIFVVDGLLDSNGSCFDIRGELLAEMELNTHPEKARKLDVDKPSTGGINESVVSNATGAKATTGHATPAPALTAAPTVRPTG